MTHELTLDAETKEWLSCHYKYLSGTILEYGSGGSTILALKSNPNNFVFTCETDPLWLESVVADAEASHVSERLVKVYTDIGATKEWGYPTCFSAKFLNASTRGWEVLRERKKHPDFVLIDGRFRVGCFLATLVNCEKHVQLLWDDWEGRNHYHIIENIIKPTRMIGRAALFDVPPNILSARALASFWLPLFLDPA